MARGIKVQHDAKYGYFVRFRFGKKGRKKKTFGHGKQAEAAAGRFAKQIEKELAAELYRPDSKKRWPEFRTKYEENLASLKRRAGTLGAVKGALDHFQRLVEPDRMADIGNDTITRYRLARSKERRPNARSAAKTVANATINKELRHIHAAFKWGKKNGYLKDVPNMERLNEPKRQPRYVTDEDFVKMYNEAAPLARWPRNPGQNYEAADWWRALFVTGWFTGRRIGQVLSLKREDVDLERGRFRSQPEDTKTDQEEWVDLHPFVVEHLRKIIGFGPLVFPWGRSRRTFFAEIKRIQREAGIETPYTFHRYRSAFLTNNADRTDPKTLQLLVGHRCISTTMGYVNAHKSARDVVTSQPVPAGLRKAE